MNTPNGGSASTPSPRQRKKLPVKPSLQHLQKQAKRRAKQNPSLKLADAQHQLAREYGCKNWGDLAKLVEVINQGLQVPLMSSSGTPNQPLQAAARSKDKDAVLRLLAAGQFTYDDLNSGLAGALWYGDPSTQWPVMKELADILLEHGADPNAFLTTYGPIVFGTGECLMPESLEWLIAAGADVTLPPVDTKYGKQCPLSYWLGTYARGHNDRKHKGIDTLLRHNPYIPPEVTLPILAIHRGDVKTLAKLVDREPELIHQQFPDMPYGNIELRGATLLHCAVEFDEWDCIDTLLDHHADINAPSLVIDGIGGQTPVFHAVCSNLSMLKHLLQRMGSQIDLNIQGSFRIADATIKLCTPLGSICQSDANPDTRLKAAQMLIDAGVNINRLCKDGFTALHHSAWRGPVEIVRLLLSQGAQSWIPDAQGKTPLEYAREHSVAPDKEAIIAALSQPRIDDPNFRAAVDAMSTGDLEKLQCLLRDHPDLATAQAEENGGFAGPYFSRPYLLEFVPENPIRTRKLPPNICEIAQAIIDAGSPKSAIDKTLGLTASACVPRECGVQTELLELLVKNGGDPSTGLDGAISQGEMEAAKTMLRLGAVPGLTAAAGLGKSERVRQLISNASRRDKEKALNAAFRYAEKETAEIVLDNGIPLDEEILDFGTPLHHAASFGNRDICAWLLERGANPNLLDSQWNGTPAGWAFYGGGHRELSEWLREQEKS